MSLGPLPMGNVPFVEMSTLSRLPFTALPKISSASPSEYVSAQSNKFTPASRHSPTSRAASSVWVLPHVLKNSLPPPKVAVPYVSTGTFSPAPPSCLYSIFQYFWFINSKQPPPFGVTILFKHLSIASEYCEALCSNRLQQSVKSRAGPTPGLW